jgi:hypothetical protein
MKITMLLCLTLLSSCAMPLTSTTVPRAPVRQALTVQESPDAAYQRATRAMVRMGGEILQTNPQARLLSAKLKGVVLLNVQVLPTPDGATIEATGTLLPGKLVAGEFDEVDTYIALLR